MTRFDRIIPPGGMGKIMLTIDTTRVVGAFKKRSVVWTNDPARRTVALFLTGAVKPLIYFEPGGYVSLWGPIGEAPPGQVEVINQSARPFRILRIDHDLANRIQWKLTPIKAGFHYRLVIEDISPKAGTYSGRMKIHTNHPRKPELVIIVNGEITPND